MLPTPFHTRTAAVCESHQWRNWAGYLAAGVYEPTHEREYFAVRNSAALIDVSPLFKYEVSGPDAERLVDRVVTRNVAKCRVGQVFYTPWCDEDGKVIDDGTVQRLDKNLFRVTAADPNLRWFQDVGFGLDAEVRDVSSQLAALALQGPNSRAILKEAVSDIDFDALNYFWLAQGHVDQHPVTVTRTGYTGDLGYELWIAAEHAELLWDRLTAVGWRYGLLPAGILALDVARIEAGLIMIAVDYVSSRHAVIPSQKSSPFEIGLGWAVSLNGADFIGKRVLQLEKQKGSPWAFVGLHLDWVALEQLFGRFDLPPKVAGPASRDARPVYVNGRHIGQMTSHTFSPILKQYIGIGTVRTPYAAIGTKVEVEVTVEYERHTVPAVVVKTPFYNPAHKRR
ncbi:MAG: aminomethyl transferase family protein [Candidatus Thermofonsia bacterium]|nr:MAG: aminomethyl transferase family protein [Candidatus Thermofonsia bacterium]